MQLSREGIQRMIGNLGSISTAAGGGGEGGSGSQWVNDNFVAIPYWNQLFTIYGKQTVTVTDGTTGDVTVTETDMTLPPNTLPSTVTTTDPETGDVTETKVEITRIEALYDFDSVGGVSALGYSPGGGGGGGADLNALLDNINSSSIGDIAPGASEVGKCLVYNGNNQWAWATPGGGGGLTYGLSWSYGSVTDAQGGSYDGSASKSFIIPKDTSHLSNDAGFITSSALSGYLPLTGGEMTGQIQRSSNGWWILGRDNAVIRQNGGSTAGWAPVFSLKTQNGSWEMGGITQTDAVDKLILTYNTDYNYNNNINSSTYRIDFPQASGTLALASQIPSLVGYATQQWVNDQGFLTYNDITNYLKVGSDGVVEGGQYYDFHMQSTTSDFSTRLQVTADNRNTLTLPSASGTLATQEWVNSQGYMLRTEGMRFTDYGNYIAARFALADGTYDSARAANAKGSGFIEWWSDGYFNHRMGSVSIYDGVNDDTCYLQIGGGRIYWDPSSKSLYVVQSDGSTPANIYATGGVSALGISTGGTPSVSELTVGTLKGVRYLQNASGAVSITSGNSYIYIGAGSGSNVYIADSNNTYFDTNGHLHLKGKYLYLDDTRYVYVSNGHLYFNNGSSNIQIA